MREIIGYRRACYAAIDLGGQELLEDMVLSGDPRRAYAARCRVAFHVAGFAGRVTQLGVAGAFEVDVPDDPRGLLLP